MNHPVETSGARTSPGALALAALAALLLLAACGGGGATAEPANTGSQPAATEAAAGSAFDDDDVVTLVVPFAPGGGFDLYTRFIQPCLEDALQESTGSSVTVLVENVTGGGGQVAAEQVYRAEPDGSRILISSQDILNTQQVIGGASYDVREMTPLAQIAEISLAVMVRPGVIAEDGDFLDLIERSQEEPILWGGSGLEITQKLLFHLLAEGGNPIQVDTVEFEGTSEAIASMLRGELEVYFVTLPTAVQQAEANPELRVLAATGETVPEGVDVPTLGELGISNADDIVAGAGRSTRVFLGPPGMPENVASTLQDAFEEALSGGPCVEEAEAAGYPVSYQPADEVERRLLEGLELIEANQDILVEE